MRLQPHELNQVSTEFHEDGAPELPELPDEFNRFPRRTKVREERSRLRKIMLYLAAMGLLTIGVFVPAKPTATSEAEENVPAAQATQGSSDTETGAPVLTPSPKPQPTPEPTVLPDFEPIYFFTHSVSNAIIVLSDPAHTTAVHVEIRDEQVHDSAFAYDLTAEEIAQGVWEETGFDLNDFYVRHAEQYEAMNTFIQPELQVSMTYRTQDGTEGTVQKIADVSSEDYVSIGYFDDSYLENEWTFPGCFTASVYDTELDPLVFTLDPDHALQPGEIFLSITVDGARITEEDCYVKRLVDTYEYEGETFSNYSFILVMRRPDSFPEHGTAHITVRQKLIHYDYIREREQDLDY